jgi:hypothetical protein
MRDFSVKSLLRYVPHWGVALAAGLSGCLALGAAPLLRGLPIASDLALAWVSPFVAILAYRHRSTLLASPIVLGCVAYSGVAVVADLIRGGASTGDLLRQLVPALAVTSAAAVSVDGGADRILRWAVLGGAAALGIAVCGYAYRLLDPAVQLPWGAFALTAPHPLFSGWPRMTGLMGRSPEHFGEYTVTLGAMAMHLRSVSPRSARRSYTLVSLFSALCLVLSFSFAWLGALPIALQLVSCRRSVASAILVIAALASLLVVTLGLPEADLETAACAQLDPAHRVARRISPPEVRRDLQCTTVIAREPYPHRPTHYEIAKLASWAALIAKPWTGVGRAAFEGQFKATLARDFAISKPLVTYNTPHDTYLGSLALHGVGAGIALLVIAFGMWRLRRAPPYLWSGALGVALIGLHIDIQYLRHFLLLLGVLATCEPLNRPADPANALPAL